MRRGRGGTERSFLGHYDVARMTGHDRTTEEFSYESFDIDRASGTLTCSYIAGGYRFEERVVVEHGDWDAPGVEAAALVVFLLSGVSYYKAFATPVINLGDHAVSASIRNLLRDFYLNGLGEFAYRNGRDLSGLQFVGGRTPEVSQPLVQHRTVSRPLVPFGGGMDSIVTVEIVRRLTPDTELFVVSRPDDRFEAIEKAAGVTGLPIARATRELDPRILRSRELGFLNGHVPVTGIISAIAVLTAVVRHRDAVVMSNEWSSSVGNLEHDGRMINHQYSKSLQFEELFRSVVEEAIGNNVNYFSLLRPYTELWIARQLADHHQYLHAFRSCNRSFHIDRSQRLDRWCGHCDKCAFVDLVLSPFIPEEDLASIFGGAEPLNNPDLIDLFRTLVGTNDSSKPFECVGDIGECRAAVRLASAREDRSDSVVLKTLLDSLDDPSTVSPATNELFEALPQHHVPEPYATDLRLA